MDESSVIGRWTKARERSRLPCEDSAVGATNRTNREPHSDTASKVPPHQRCWRIDSDSTKQRRSGLEPRQSGLVDRQSCNNSVRHAHIDTPTITQILDSSFLVTAVFPSPKR